MSRRRATATRRGRTESDHPEETPKKEMKDAMNMASQVAMLFVLCFSPEVVCEGDFQQP